MATDASDLILSIVAIVIGGTIVRFLMDTPPPIHEAQAITPQAPAPPPAPAPQIDFPAQKKPSWIVSPDEIWKLNSSGNVER